MQKMIKNIGLDVHKNSILIGIADDGRDGEVRYYGKIDNDMNQLDKVIRKFISQGSVLRFVYEAGPCGYGIYRYLTNNNMDCVVIAASKIPQHSGNRLKNDRRDCLSLARLHRAGELTAVYVPATEDEALRDLVRARIDETRALRGAKQQLGAFLLRHELLHALQAIRGISLIVAATIASELGDLTRFETPGKLMAFLGRITITRFDQRAEAGW